MYSTKVFQEYGGENLHWLKALKQQNTRMIAKTQQQNKTITQHKDRSGNAYNVADKLASRKAAGCSDLLSAWYSTFITTIIIIITTVTITIIIIVINIYSIPCSGSTVRLILPTNFAADSLP